MSEASILANVRIALAKAGVTIFRNQTGALRDRQDRLVRFGLCKGGSDLIGFRSVLVTPDMVGTRVAVFVACEVKDTDGRATAEQTNFLRTVLEAGGIAMLVRSPEEAVAGLVKLR
jgi:hypothetical protein